MAGGRRHRAERSGAHAGARTPLPAPLLPLSDADQQRSHETGCQTSFLQGDARYVLLLGHDLMIRTAPGAAGLHVCHISDAQFPSFGHDAAAISCAGRRLTMQYAGRTITHAEIESSEGDAVLTMSDGTHSRQVRGGWASGC